MTQRTLQRTKQTPGFTINPQQPSELISPPFGRSELSTVLQREVREMHFTYRFGSLHPPDSRCREWVCERMSPNPLRHETWWWKPLHDKRVVQSHVSLGDTQPISSKTSCSVLHSKVDWRFEKKESNYFSNLKERNKTNIFVFNINSSI